MPVLWVRASRFDEINNLAQEHITCMGGGVAVRPPSTTLCHPLVMCVRS